MREDKCTHSLVTRRQKGGLSTGNTGEEKQMHALSSNEETRGGLGTANEHASEPNHAPSKDEDTKWDVSMANADG